MMPWAAETSPTTAPRGELAALHVMSRVGIPTSGISTKRVPTRFNQAGLMDINRRGYLLHGSIMEY